MVSVLLWFWIMYSFFFKVFGVVCIGHKLMRLVVACRCT